MLGLRLLEYSESAINRKNVDVIVNFLSGLITVPTPQFLNNIITGSGVMTTFVYKELTRNPEIGDTTV